MTAGRARPCRGRKPQEAAALVRILTPVLKFRATRDARKVCGDALEMRGGVGYIEEFAPARLLRDAHLGSIWEGTSNIVALDAITRAVGRHGAHSALGADLHARLNEAVGNSASPGATSSAISSIAQFCLHKASRPILRTNPTRAARRRRSTT